MNSFLDSFNLSNLSVNSSLNLFNNTLSELVHLSLLFIGLFNDFDYLLLFFNSLVNFSDLPFQFSQLTNNFLSLNAFLCLSTFLLLQFSNLTFDFSSLISKFLFLSLDLSNNLLFDLPDYLLSSRFLPDVFNLIDSSLKMAFLSKEVSLLLGFTDDLSLESNLFILRGLLNLFTSLSDNLFTFSNLSIKFSHFSI